MQAAPADSEASQRAVERFKSEQDEAIERRYVKEARERRLYLRPFDLEVAGCIDLWKRRSDADARDQAVRALSASLKPWMDRSESDLEAAVTDQGSHDPVNLDLRDACLHFAQLWSLTGDPSCAGRSRVLLVRFAAAIPKWPIWTPYYGDESSKRPLSPDDPASYQGEFSAGPWGSWIYMDLVMAQPLLDAWTILRGAAHVAPDPVAMRSLFDHFVRVQRMRGSIPDYSNMDAFQIRGTIDFGRLLPDPELLHDGVRHLQAMYRLGFFPDGWWHEGATDYHTDLQQGLRSIVEDFPDGYSDPPGFRSAVDGQRYDGLQLRSLVAGPLERADRVIRATTLPNGLGLATHDSDWQAKSPLPPDDRPVSHLFGAMGQGTLASGGNGAQTLVTLHYGASGSHAHHDALNLNMWSKGREVISETNYRPPAGSNTTRAWHTSTAGHATVVVDERDQDCRGPLGSHVRLRQPDDAIPGITDWPWRWTTCAPDDFGTLRLFAADFDRVQVIEADATVAYDAVAPVQTYRRTVALVQIDGDDTYVVDIFRVRGGSTHDYMLHACLQDAYESQVSVALAPHGGTLHGMISGLKSARTDKLWVSSFQMPDSTRLYSFVAPSADTEVITGSAPAMRRTGDATFVIARRRSADSIFFVVHHASTTGASRVRWVEPLPVDGAGVVAFRITLDTRTDVVISADAPSRSARVDGRIDFTGAFAHLAEGRDVRSRWMYLVDGSRLTAGDRSIEGDVSVAGMVTRVDRKDDGSPVNGFVTPTKLPEGRNLFGQVMIVEPDGLPAWAYWLEGVQAVADGSKMLTSDEPGLVVEGDHMKQVFFPNWGSRGRMKFRVPGSALLLPKDDGSGWDFWGTGAAKYRAFAR